jgi:hypothetical protein
MYQYLHKSWSHFSHNPIWSAVIAAMITAATIGIVDTASELLTKKSPPVPVERAEIRGGTWGPSRLLYRCMPDGKCIAPNHVVFDSIANDPRIGNEAYFMGAKVLGSLGSMQSKVAVLANRRHKGLSLSDDILGEGTLVGSGRPNGTFPPGLSNYAAVFLLVHIVSPTA